MHSKRETIVQSMKGLHQIAVPHLQPICTTIPNIRHICESFMSLNGSSRFQTFILCTAKISLGGCCLCFAHHSADGLVPVLQKHACQANPDHSVTAVLGDRYKQHRYLLSHHVYQTLQWSAASLCNRFVEQFCACFRSASQPWTLLPCHAHASCSVVFCWKIPCC